jgi:hypothetical protein
MYGQWRHPLQWWQIQINCFYSSIKSNYHKDHEKIMHLLDRHVILENSITGTITSISKQEVADKLDFELLKSRE